MPGRVGIVMIATGHYTAFVENLYQSIEKHFLRDHQTTYFLFTDSDSVVLPGFNYIPVVRRGFPQDSLTRYHKINSIRDIIATENVGLLYYLDVDMLVVSDVGTEFIPTPSRPLIAVSHPGFWSHPMTGLVHRPLHWFGKKSLIGEQESNPNSTAYIGFDEGYRHYVCGGVQGGFTEAFLDASERMAKQIDQDEGNGITAIWHDESHWNRFVASNLQSVSILTPDYCFPESWELAGCTRRIVALDKDHAFYRSDPEQVPGDTKIQSP